jgi:hypothetical protein
MPIENFTHIYVSAKRGVPVPSLMPSSNQTAVEWLNQATLQLNRYVLIVIYLFGTIGSLLNVIVLSQRALRSNFCAFLFLMSSIASLIAIQSGLTNASIFHCYQANLTSMLQPCHSRTLPCRIYIDMSYGCGSILIPALLMIYFSSMIIVNVRRTRRRLDFLSKSTMLSSITAVQFQRTKKKDNRLLPKTSYSMCRFY